VQGETTIVVPCFNERDRFDSRAFLRLATSGGLRLLLVDDGSTDGTGAVLESLAARCPTRVSAMALERNVGKGEAVRRGLARALAEGADIVGYLDGDLSTPVDEAARLVAKMRTAQSQVLLGSRVKLIGRVIDRRVSRHYAGRVFATLASAVLTLPVYDTQCGAKLFRRSPTLTAALASPFASRWAFDVELLQRLLLGTEGKPPIAPRDVLEEPLEVWRDVAGSKLGLLAALLAGLSLLRLAAPPLRAAFRSITRRLTFGVSVTRTARAGTS
jgi:glycosyltransferase involved in cell wall biosynthesis